MKRLIEVISVKRSETKKLKAMPKVRKEREVKNDINETILTIHSFFYFKILECFKQCLYFNLISIYIY
jgi:hypothetical protein